MVAICFLTGAVAIALLTVSLPLALLLLFVAIAGLGTSGTQTLIYGRGELLPDQRPRCGCGVVRGVPGASAASVDR